MAPSLTQECSICATTKSKTSSFKEYENTCEHFDNIYNLCIAKMLRVKVSERQLADVELRCPFLNCEHSLGHGALRKAIGKEAFEKCEAEVTKYIITTDDSYIACLSTECGLHFSIEGLKNSQCTKQSIGCPCCNLETCYEYNRPLYTHDDIGNCNTAKRAEDKESEAEIKKMGAKFCPHCGLKIEKYGGCDYMVCQHCQCEFCWDCLVEFNLHKEHLPSGRNAHSYDIGHGPRDFAPDPATLA